MAERIRVEAQLIATVEGFKQEMVEARRRLDSMARGVGRTNAHLRNFQTRLDRAGRSLRNFGAAVVGAGIAEVSRQLATGFVETADAMTQVEGRLRVVAGEFAQVSTVQQDLLEISQRTRSDFVSNTQAFARLGVAVRATRENYRELLTVIEAVNLTGAISGTSTAEQSAVLTQLLQALGSNRLGGEELRSIREQNARLTRILTDIAEAQGTSLKEFAEQGGLTRDVVTAGIVGAIDELRAEFELLPPTVQQVFTQIQNTLGQAVGELNKTFRITQRITEALTNFQQSFTTDNIIAFTYAIGDMTENIRTSLSYIAGFIKLINASGFAINTLSVALQALPFFGAARAISGIIGVAGRARLSDIGRSLAQSRLRRRYGLDKDLTKDEIDLINRGIVDPLPENLKNIGLDRLREYQDRLSKLGTTTQNVVSGFEKFDTYSTRGFIAGTSLTGIYLTLRGYNALTDSIEDFNNERRQLVSLEQRIRDSLEASGKVFDTYTGKVIDASEAIKRFADLEKAEQARFKDRDERDRRQTALTNKLLSEDSEYISLIRERIDALKRLGQAEQERNRGGGALGRGAFDAEARISQELDDIRNRITLVVRRVRGEARKALLDQEVADLKKPPVKVPLPVQITPRFTLPPDALSGPPLILLQSRIRNWLQEGGVIEEPIGVPVPVRLEPEFRPIVEITDQLRLATARIGIGPGLRNLGVFNSVIDRETKRRDLLQQQVDRQRALQESARRYAEQLSVVTAAVGSIATQVQNVAQGFQSWQNALRGVTTELINLVNRMLVIEPLARKIVNAINPGGASAFAQLAGRADSVTSGFFNLPGRGGTGFFRSFSQRNETNNYYGSAAIELGLRRDRTRATRDVLSVAAQNPGAYEGID